MFLLDLDPSIVKPGWPAAVVFCLLAVALVLLYLSMRRQLRKITLRREADQPEVAPDPKSTGTG